MYVNISRYVDINVHILYLDDRFDIKKEGYSDGEFNKYFLFVT